MIRIRLEGETWNEIVEQLRQMVGDDKPLPLFGLPSPPQNEAPESSVEPPPQVTTVTDTPPTIPAIDALPKAPAPPPPPPAATAAPDVDARGIPWDGRIHAGNKAQTKDKSWKRRRGVSVEEVQRIEAGLTGTPAPPTTDTAQAPPPPAPAELPGTEPPPITFDQVMREAGQRNLGITNLNALAAEVTGGQIGQIALIADKPAYIQAVYDRMTAS
jgi:hypothetical protein